MEEEQGRQLVRLIDWLVVLPAESQRQVWQRLLEQGGEKAMPFRVYPEQVGYDRGLLEGEKKGLLRAIQLGLKLKFGDVGLALMPLVRAQNDLGLLQKILEVVEETSSFDDVSRLFPGAPPP